MARELGRLRVRKFEALEPRWALNAADYAGGFGVGTSESGQQVAVQGDLGTLILRDGKVARYSDGNRLDATFGNGGSIDLDGPSSYGGDLAADSLNRVLVGVSYRSRDHEAVLLRFLSDGKPDLEFGDGGRVTFARPGVLESIASLSPLAGGRVLVGLHGATTGSLDALVRLDTHGQIDTSFGVDGWYNGRVGQLLTPTVSDTGEIFLSIGNDAATRISVQRLTGAGAIDLSYGDNGTVQIPFEGIWPDLGELEVDGQGRVLLQFVDKINQVKIIRIDEHGAIDRGFGVDGLTTLSFPYTEYAVPCGIEVQANGRILTGFFTVNYSMTWPTQYAIYRSYLTRLTPDGATDVTFGSDSIIESRPAWYVEGRLLEFFVRADGEIVASLDSPGRYNSVNSGGVTRLLGDPVNRAPTAIELSNRFLPEDAQAGYVVGTLTAVDNGLLATGLVLLVDRADLSVRVVNPTRQQQIFDNYRLRSSTRQLSRTGWRSIADWVASGPEAKAQAEQILGVGHTNWKEAVAGSSTLWEAADIWTRLEPGAEIELGKPLLSFPSDVDFAVIDSFGTKYNEVMWEPAPPTFELLDSAGGLFRLDGDRLVVADPSALDFETTKQYTVRVRATDEGGLSYTQDLVVEVGNVNEAPAIDTPAVWLTQPNTWLAMVGIVLDDPDLQGDDLNSRTLRLHIDAEQGIVQLASVAGLAVQVGANGSESLEVEGTLPALNAALATLSFQASAGFSGMAIVNLRIDDQGSLGSGPARATDAALRVTVNSVPVARSDEFHVAFSGTLSGGTVLANDTDFDGNRLTALLVESPKHGTLQFTADGSFNYTPSPGFAGRDSFRYRAVDGFFESAEVDVLLEVGAGDANLDGQVDLTDFGILKQHFGAGPTRAEGDFNGDGRVDLDDFGIFKAAFGTAIEEAAQNQKVRRTLA